MLPSLPRSEEVGKIERRMAVVSHKKRVENPFCNFLYPWETKRPFFSSYFGMLWSSCKSSFVGDSSSPLVITSQNLFFPSKEALFPLWMWEILVGEKGSSNSHVGKTEMHCFDVGRRIVFVWENLF